MLAPRLEAVGERERREVSTAFGLKFRAPVLTFRSDPSDRKLHDIAGFDNTGEIDQYYVLYVLILY